jgi:hypothetical protein
LYYIPDGKDQLKQIITNTRIKGRDEEKVPSFRSSLLSISFLQALGGEDRWVEVVGPLEDLRI